MIKILLFIIVPSLMLSCKNDTPENEPFEIHVVSSNIYPNPCKDFFIVEIEPKQHEYTLVLHNRVGDFIWKIKTPTGSFRANVDTLSSGIYLLSVISKDTINNRVAIVH